MTVEEYILKNSVLEELFLKAKCIWSLINYNSHVILISLRNTIHVHRICGTNSQDWVKQDFLQNVEKLITRILSGTLINACLAYSVLVYLAQINGACNFLSANLYTRGKIKLNNVKTYKNEAKLN